MYRLSPVKQKIVDRVAEIADERIAPHAERVDRDGAFPREYELIGRALCGMDPLS